jgi:hypothetical protein
VSRSFAEAEALLGELADLSVSAKQVERVARRMGAERVEERDAAVAAYQALPLVQKFDVPTPTQPPELAVVMVDGGRLQIRERHPPPPAPVGPPAKPPGAGAEEEAWDEEEVSSGKARYWREDKIGLLLTMQSTVAANDPCPDIPPSFVDAARIPELARELNKHVKQAEDTATPAPHPHRPEAADGGFPAEVSYQPPQAAERRVVGTCGPWRSFAPIVAAAAWAWGFMGAARKAFVADGAANNWRLQRRFFASFVPILDFIHALSYVFAAAMAGRSFAAGWACYRQWIGWVWQGQVAEVITALEGRQAELGLPGKEEAEASPRQVVATTLTYLRNHQDKMRYDAYRRQGLPLTSSLMESVVKQVNQRVKGTEKFWCGAGGEAIVQLRADYLSDGQPLEEFWQRRQAAATGQNRYHRRAG